LNQEILYVDAGAFTFFSLKMTVVSTSTPGGDDVNAVVLDVGAANFRAGFAGEDVPRIFESSTMTTPEDSDVDMTSGRSSTAAPVNFYSRSRDGLMKHAIHVDNKSTSIDVDSDVLEQIIQYSFLNSSRGFNLELSDTPLILTEPNKPSSKYRRACIETMFERFLFPAASLLKRAPSSAFAAGKQSGLVLDIGASMTSATPVFDGFVLQKSASEYFGVGGDLLDSVMDEALRKKRVKVDMPFYKQTEGVSAKFLEQSRLAVVRAMKQEVCRVSSSSLSSVNGYANWNISSTSSSYYELPDGTSVEVSPLNEIIPEILFDPAPLSSFPHLNITSTGFKGIGAAVTETISNCDIDARKAIGSDIILVGGSSLFHGMPERLLSHLTSPSSRISVQKPKVTASSVSVDRQSSSWLGASIVACCATFQQLWISKRQYEEEGFDRLLTKQLFW
jgi:actin-like protein 6A